MRCHINWCAEHVRTALDATLELDIHGDGHVFHFAGTKAKYALRLSPSSNMGMMAADPVEPIQGCPLLEYYFKCDFVVVGENAYNKEDGLAVRCYKDVIDFYNMQLTLTPIGGGDWYIWANGTLDRPK
tara:strand:+ start:1798 stop:2181 length:384 start_codon:yes stop_codon:yes gene_type:complete